MAHASPLPNLCQISDADKDALIMALWTQLDAALAANAELMAKVEALTARVAELEAKLNEPPKTPDNSSLPPSHGHKTNKPLRRKRRKGHRNGVGRELHPDPDHIVEARAETCPSCAAALAEGDQNLQAVYERIELPPIKPIVTQVRLHGGACPHCGEAFTARPPPGLEPGSPFGSSIEALAVCLHHCQAIGFERLAALFRDIFGLPISEGALASLFKRVKPRFDEQAIAIKQRVLDSSIVCSDETSARVEGRTGGNGSSPAPMPSSMSSSPAGARRCRRRSSGIDGPRSGSPTCPAPSRDTPGTGRFASPTNFAMSSMLSMPATASSLR